MAATPPEGQEFWLDFIECYRSFLSLWKIKSEDYKNRNLKGNCYKQLVEMLKEHIPTATKDLVCKKINAFRTSYRRELKMVIKSEKSGAGSDDIYKPSLWYYDALGFLRDQETQEEGLCTMELDEGVKCLPAPVKTDSPCLRHTTRHDAYSTSGDIHKPSYQLRVTTSHAGSQDTRS
ncbi:hypothetical protein E2C01_051832 [Portunus trituberculatus]|uniref:MADF domain-containing protein n=1 Tax=Portunus trituberculatus TaxID=210409 RepID=A0A5B7GMT2_PORTR|nr:hypothetical protein [Portunus trituberculatus]